MQPLVLNWQQFCLYHLFFVYTYVCIYSYLYTCVCIYMHMYTHTIFQITLKIIVPFDEAQDENKRTISQKCKWFCLDTLAKLFWKELWLKNRIHAFPFCKVKIQCKWISPFFWTLIINLKKYPKYIRIFFFKLNLWFWSGFRVEVE